MNLPKKFNSRVLEAKYLNPITMELTLEVIEPAEIEFTPGQFISLAVGEGKFRSYSISSDHLDKKHIKIALAVAHDGIGANYVKSLNQGDSAVFIGPSGKFVLPEILAPELLFMVTGTGFTPIASMLNYLLEIKSESKIRLYFGLRTDKYAFYLELLDKCKAELKDFSYYLCLTEPDHTWQGFHGHITDFYQVPNPETTQAFVCGNPNMVHEVLNLLQTKGVPESNVFHEKFTMSVSSTSPKVV